MCVIVILIIYADQLLYVEKKCPETEIVWYYTFPCKNCAIVHCIHITIKWQIS